MDFKLAKFRANLEQLTATAWSAIDEYDLILTHGADAPPEEVGPQKAAVRERLRYAIRSMVTTVRFGLEHLGAAKLSEQLESEITGLPELLQALPNWDDDGLSCDAISITWRYANGLLAGFEQEEGEEFERERLSRFLKNTAHILQRDGAQPQNETDVKKHLLKYLGAMYPDAINEPSLAKPEATFRADTGVKNLKTAVEYKYADTQAKLLGAMDGILADVKNYEKHEVWKHFIAVLYMTGAFLSEEAKASYESKFPPNWELITVVGESVIRVKGRRKKDATASASKSSG
jgi:hypothetical protein